MTTTTGYETNMEQPLALGWLPLVNRAIFLRATIIAVVIGSVLTLINQSIRLGRWKRTTATSAAHPGVPDALCCRYYCAGRRGSPSAHRFRQAWSARKARRLYSHCNRTRDSSKRCGNRADFWEFERIHCPSGRDFAFGRSRSGVYRAPGASLCASAIVRSIVPSYFVQAFSLPSCQRLAETGGAEMLGLVAQRHNGAVHVPPSPSAICRLVLST